MIYYGEDFADVLLSVMEQKAEATNQGVYRLCFTIMSMMTLWILNRDNLSRVFLEAAFFIGFDKDTD